MNKFNKIDMNNVKNLNLNEKEITYNVTNPFLYFNNFTT